MKITILTILLIIALVVPSHAELTLRQHHDIHHISLSCIGTSYLNHYTDLNWYESALAVFIAGILWECADHTFHLLQKESSIFDYYRGFDHMDVSGGFRGGEGALRYC